MIVLLFCLIFLHFSLKLNECKMSTLSENYKHFSFEWISLVRNMQPQELSFSIEKILQSEHLKSENHYPSQSMQCSSCLYSSCFFDYSCLFQHEVYKWTPWSGNNDRRTKKCRTTFSIEQVFRLEEIFKKRVK